MWPKGFAPWRGETRAGPAIATLRVAGTSTASILRVAGVVFTVAQVVIWHSFYLTPSWRLAGPLVAIVWGIAAVLYLLRRWPGWQLSVVDTAVYVALALCARWVVPSVLRGDSSNWLYITLIGHLVAPAWFTPGEILALLAIGSGAAYWAGAELVPSVSSHSAAPVTAAGMMLTVAFAAWCGRRLLYRKAVAADSALERADRESREQYVVLSRYTERREHERLLHDTVLNTLTALARPDISPRDLAQHCRDDVALIEQMLGGQADMDAAERDPVSGLLTALEAVAATMRSRGLAVHIERSQPTGPAPVLPERVARATAHAVREALTNVDRHAGTREAWVRVSLADDGLQVTIRDAGVGFDPARTGTARLGLRRSIVERMADQGGNASVLSAPGQGTIVSLRWAPPAHTHQTANVSGRDGDGRW